MKTCKDCGETLPFTDFNPRPRNRDGYDVRCRQCRYIRYNKSDPMKVLKIIYERQIGHSVTRGHTPPAYSIEDLGRWIDTQPGAADLWQRWIDSGYQTELKPSIDRIDDTKGYALDNIRLITWAENREKGAASKRNGTIITLHKPVLAHNRDGSFHKKYVSINDALRDLGGGNAWGITTVANGEPVKDGRGYLYTPRTYKGFKWKWG